MNDPVLIARLRDYLRESHGGRSQVDISTVVSDLRSLYPEYGRRSMSAFRQRVALAYGVLQQKQQNTSNVSGQTPPATGYVIDYSPDNKSGDQLMTSTPLTPGIATGGEKNNNNSSTGPEVRPAKVRRRRSPTGADASGEGLLPPAFSEVVKPAVYPSLRLADLGGLDHIRTDIDRVLRHLRNASLLRQLGAEPTRGLLLHGPPGCGKTSLAIALAGELGLPLIHSAGPELVAGISGQSEAHLRNLFKSAATRHKETGCVLFIDELDVVAGRRESVSRDLERRLVSQLLLCIDGMPTTVLLIGATSRPDALDPGLRRTGRFDRELCLGQPGESERADMLRVLTRTVPLGSDVNLTSVARLTPGYVASDLRALVNAAAGVAVERYSLSDNKTSEEAPPQPEVIGADLENAIDVDQDDEAPIEAEPLKVPPDLKVEYQDFLAAVRFVQPSAKREGFATVPDVNWGDVGSLEAVRYELFMAVVAPLHRPDIFAKLGLKGSPGSPGWQN